MGPRCLTVGLAEATRPQQAATLRAAQLGGAGTHSLSSEAAAACVGPVRCALGRWAAWAPGKGRWLATSPVRPRHISLWLEGGAQRPGGARDGPHSAARIPVANMTLTSKWK